jgi:peptide/nickel transport system ATP-binding protein
MVNQEAPLLEIADLTVGYRQGSSWMKAVRNVSLQIWAGQSVGLVGESGSGKTTLAMTVMGYLPPEGEVLEGTIRFRDRELQDLSDREMRSLWGDAIALVPQGARAALNPSIRIGDQAAEILRYHRGLSRKAAAEQVRASFERVQLGDVHRIASAYPHQLSGGMLQRVLIAMALSTEPALLVLDEPTSSLDVTTQAEILRLVRRLIQGERQTAALFITHNLSVVAQLCDRVAVMYAGDLVEEAPTRPLFRQPLHPYSRGLLDCVPIMGRTKQEVELRPIRGHIPDLQSLPEGCVFRPRCPLAIEVCQQYPPLYAAGEGRRSRCHRWEGIHSGELNPAQEVPEREAAVVGAATTTALELRDVAVHFTERASLPERLRGERATVVRAVDGVSLSLGKGRTLGLVGESGSGKTTLARAIVGLVPRSSGDIEFLDMAVPPKVGKRSRAIYSALQVVFQDPADALNPFLGVGEALRRPIERLRRDKVADADAAVAELLQSVDLSPSYALRLPGELSGGEKQRVAIARAFAPNPAVLLADEPVSSLDVSVQASILSMLLKLQAEHGTGIIFISHNVAVVGYLADDIAVIYLGELMEVAPTARLFEPPYHPYTEALLASVPLLDPDAEQREIELSGDVPSPSNKPSGCPFHTRCPRFLGDLCAQQRPPWREEKESGKRYFCHIPWDDLARQQEPIFRFSDEDGEV